LHDTWNLTSLIGEFPTFFSARRRQRTCNTCTAPQAAYRSCSGAVYVTDKANVQPIGRRLSLLSQTDLWPTIHTQPWSAV